MYFFYPPSTKKCPSLGPPVKVSMQVSCTIDGLDLTSNCQAYVLTAVLTKSVGLHPNAGLRVILLTYKHTNQYRLSTYL